MTVENKDPRYSHRGQVFTSRMPEDVRKGYTNGATPMRRTDIPQRKHENSKLCVKTVHEMRGKKRNHPSELGVSVYANE
ncbi:hypothetical protein R1flu_023270 [Riccia fluitans]|uniref:Uncharacterized protein n=1 Tax=Riccia fluitans TaxID=41844 RepID=A0ABD1XVN5_9MARC